MERVYDRASPMNSLRHISFWLILIVLCIIALIPLVTGSPVFREEIFLILMLVTFASSINIITGYTGYVSFGHIVFFGLGGYIAFYLMLNDHVHLIIAALIGGIITSLIALLLGIPVLRLRGAYFALATIGINEAVAAFINNYDAFGSSTGMFFNAAAFDVYGGTTNALWLAYYSIAVVALATVASSYYIKRSKFGLGLMAIREDQDAARQLGVDSTRYKIMAFTISAFFPALAGAIFFFKNSVIQPEQAFDLLLSIEGLVMMMLGGFGTVAGPIVGAIIYERMQTFLLTSPVFSSLHLAIAGVLLLLIVLFVTAGVVGWLCQREPRLRRYLE